jgi:serine/threonine protein phosphatase PrpC
MDTTSRRRCSSLLVFGSLYEIGAATLSGSDPDRPNKVNQDGYFVVVPPASNSTNVAYNSNNNRQPSSSSWIAIGVMDGHGIKGHELVRFLQTRLPVRLKEYMMRNSTDEEVDLKFREAMELQKQDLIALANADPSEWDTTTTITGNENDISMTSRIQNALRNAFVAAHLDARRDPTIPSGRSGTTCAVALLVLPKETTNESTMIVYAAVVGDSRIFVASHTVNNDDDDHASWSIQPWTETTTTTTNPAERKRIELSEGRIDANGNVFYGPVGIAMTRSLGNAVMIRAGVIPIPIIQKWTLPLNATSTNTTHYICAVTDGVCDVLTKEQVVDMIRNSVKSARNDERGSATLEELVQQICDASNKAWLADLPIEPKVDDMTCVILKYSTGV